MRAEATTTRRVPVTAAGCTLAGPERGTYFIHSRRGAYGEERLWRVVAIVDGRVRFGELDPAGADGGRPRRPFVEIPPDRLADNVARWLAGPIGRSPNLDSIRGPSWRTPLH